MPHIANIVVTWPAVGPDKATKRATFAVHAPEGAQVEVQSPPETDDVPRNQTVCPAAIEQTDWETVLEVDATDIRTLGNL